MFTRFTDNIITREEGTLQRVLGTLVDQLSQEQSIFTDQKDVVLKRTISSMERWLDRIFVPEKINAEQGREKAPMDEFFSQLEFVMRRDLTRIFSLYQLASNIDDILEGKTNSAGEIESQATELIQRVLSTRKSKAIFDENQVTYGFRSSSDVESGNLFQEPSIGILTAGVAPLGPVETTQTIESNREVYLQSPYQEIEPETVQSLEAGTPVYDTDREPLDIVIDSQSQGGFNMLAITLDSHFEVKKVEGDFSGNGAFREVTEEILGKPISVEGESFAQPTTESLLQADGSERYSIWFPEVVISARVTIRIIEHDLQPVNIGKVTDNHGETMHVFSASDSLLVSRAVSAVGYEEKLQEINEKIAEGELSTAVELRPIRNVNILSVSALSPQSSEDGEGRLRTVSSTVAISKVQIYVDAYDPENLVEYFVDSTGNEKIPISPVNINPIHPTEVEFEGTFPVQVNIIVSIPAGGAYLPTLNGIVIRTEEANA